jgi:pimeloyl-ACP methyl ester carboxylesterase
MRPGWKAKPSYAQMARGVVAVMDHQQLESASIVGWSDGGEVALELATHHAARVDKLVVFGATYDATGNKPRGGRSSTFSLYARKCRGLRDAVPDAEAVRRARRVARRRSGRARYRSRAMICAASTCRSSSSTASTTRSSGPSMLARWRS